MSDNTIDKLRIEVTADVKKAVDQIKKVRLQVDEVNKNLSGVNLGPLNTSAKVTSSSLKDAAEQAKDMMGALDSGGLTKFSKKFEKSFKKIIGAIGRIALYRAIRKLLKDITAAIKDSIQELAKVDAVVNKSMSAIKSSTSYMKYAIGLLSGVLANTFAPVISSITVGIGNAFNAMMMFFAKLRGDKTVTQAKLEWEDYADAIKKAKSATSGFDELNIITGDKEKYSTEEVGDTSSLERGLGISVALGAAVAAILPALASMSGKFGVIAGLALKGVKAFGLMGGKVMLIAAAAALVVGIIAKAYKENESVRVAVDSLMVAIGMIAEVIGGVITEAVYIISSLIELIMPIVSGMIIMIASVLAPILKLIGSSLQFILSLVRLIVDFVLFFLEPISMVLGFVFKIGVVVQEWLIKPFEYLVNLATKFFGLFKQASEGVRVATSDFRHKHNVAVGYTNVDTKAATGQFTGLESDGWGWGDLLGGTGVSEGYSFSDLGGPSGGANTEVKVFLDSKEIAAQVEKRLSRRGAPIFG